MRLLLDTHALLRWLTDDPALSQKAREAIAEPSFVVFVSAASAWEIATKHRSGKLSAAAQLIGRLGEIVKAESFQELPISLAHAERAGSSGEHRDPFDWMLLAQALRDNLALVSNEGRFDAFGVTRLW